MKDVHRESLEEEATHATDEARMVLPGVQAIRFSPDRGL
jgi:hypothetical protein